MKPLTMKPLTLAILCFALVASKTVLPQQPTDWRPSVAEDNKTATWENTFAFLTNTLSGASSPWCDDSDCRNGISTVELLPGPACKLHLRVNSVNFTYPQFHHEQQHLVTSDRSLTMGSIDPLSIRVFMKGQDDGHNWRILLTGTNNGEIGDEKACSQEADARTDLKDLKAASNSCSSAQRKAQISLMTLKSERLSFQDMETARRVARALMHMTLLCGGAKAVSPF